MRISFNEKLEGLEGSGSFELVFHVPEDAVSVDLPYDTMFHEEQKQGAVNGGYTAGIDAGEYKYYKRFRPEEYRGGHVSAAQFEAFTRNASVFVNQSKVGGSATVYGFYGGGGELLRYGEETRYWSLSNAAQGARRYSGAGIYKDDWSRSGEEYLCEAADLRFTTTGGR